jgi:hypothetical protein
MYLLVMNGFPFLLHSNKFLGMTSCCCASPGLVLPEGASCYLWPSCGSVGTFNLYCCCSCCSLTLVRLRIDPLLLFAYWLGWSRYVGVSAPSFDGVFAPLVLRLSVWSCIGWNWRPEVRYWNIPVLFSSRWPWDSKMSWTPFWPE